MHPLHGAWLRFGRADMHISEATELVMEYGRACQKHIVADNDTNPDHPTLRLKSTPDLPDMLAVVISDAIHNMRAALDYTVFELAKKDSGKVQDGTQFLIEDAKVNPGNPKRGFDARSPKYLKGLCARHVAMIESFQPYNGADWAQALRDISNPDKHRQLTVINREGTFSLTYRGGIDLATQKPLIINPDHWDVDAENAIYVSPPDLSKPGLMPTLGDIQLGVCQVLELFQGEF